MPCLFFQQSPGDRPTNFSNPVYDLHRPTSDSIILPSHGPHYESSSDPADPVSPQNNGETKSKPSLPPPVPPRDSNPKEFRMMTPRALDPTDDDERDIAGLVKSGEM